MHEHFNHKFNGKKYDKIVVCSFGGDGILNECYNGLERSVEKLAKEIQESLYDKIIVTSLPCGTANVHFYYRNDYKEFDFNH